MNPACRYQRAPDNDQQPDFASATTIKSPDNRCFLLVPQF